MKLGLMQPYFMPYVGYWQRIHAVDEHVIYDDVNYIKGGWMNRNCILYNGEKKFFNIPLKGASPNKLINEVKVDTNPVLWKKLIKTLDYAYRKAPYFNETMDIISVIFKSEEENLAKFLTFQIQEICRYLEIKTNLVISSNIEKDNSLKGQDKVIEICRKEGAEIYYNASTGEHLYSKEVFRKNGLELIFIKDKGTVQYKQTKEGFIPSLSIIDIMMNCSKIEIKQLMNDFEVY